ncbi:pilus assembly PilX family protein [Methyloradius palustris]|uniref:Type 4 fimbrial biogenesis protein PilX N-terminal domain-containing protein n=1 Tax=Methyloradius palustris TaxID=2778876 RepID=A0A8D5GD85_9PROT|nr:hypothetical protein [Methyloradius palustris]BCM26146.1 hypothetical protein ZMTM_24050 [Methyloradius palustris]
MNFTKYRFIKMKIYYPKIAKQEGVILLVALIVLVAMTLAAIAMVRSVDTTNIIAGNLAFQQSATNAADVGAELAIKWLQDNNVGTKLRVDSLGDGYAATWDPTIGYDWSVLAAIPQMHAKSAGSDVGGTGNSVNYIIQRMCKLQGVDVDPDTPSAGCAVPASISTVCITAGCVPIIPPRQQYYRITSQVLGPRNTVSYVQTIVAL